ncbi:MAG TPA: hypothetical protein VGK32_17005 [Vicinamibacterales bacterium]
MVNKLAYGDFDTPGGGGARAVAVDLLMEAVKKLYPDALTELYRDVHHPAISIARRPNWTPGQTTLVQVPSAELQCWAARWHLSCEIVFTWAFWKIGVHDGELEPPKSATTIPQAYSLSWRGHPTESDAYPFDARPDGQRREQFLARVHAEAAAAAAAHWDARVSAAKKQGYQRAPSKRRREHFEWFVRLQCGPPNLTLTALAGSVNQAPNTVHGALETTARLLGLKRRPLPRSGRPRRTP